MAIQTPTENWFKFPNHIADNLQDYDPYELKILVFMLRRTVGMLGLTSTPDQRFSLSFLAKNTGLSKSQIIRAKKSLIAKGAIIEEGEGDDGSHLLSVSWSVQQGPDSSQQTQGVVSNRNQQVVSNGTTDKDISLKKEKENTLDASASSTAPEKIEIRKPITHLPPDVKIETKVQVSGSKEGKKQLQAAVEEQKIPFKEIQKLFLDNHREYIDQIGEMPSEEGGEVRGKYFVSKDPDFYGLSADTVLMNQFHIPSKKEKYWQCRCGYEKKMSKNDSEYKLCPVCNITADSIPYKEIQQLFLDRHREFRKVKAEIFMPRWNAKEQIAIKRLYDGMKEQGENGPRYIELNDKNVLSLFGKMISAFTKYLSNGKSNTYTETTPILPSQLTDKVLNRIIPYLQKEETHPKLEIKKYEQTGKYIGPMPEGW